MYNRQRMKKNNNVYNNLEFLMSIVYIKIKYIIYIIFKILKSLIIYEKVTVVVIQVLIMNIKNLQGKHSNEYICSFYLCLNNRGDEIILLTDGRHWDSDKFDFNFQRTVLDIFVVFTVRPIQSYFDSSSVLSR